MNNSSLNLGSKLDKGINPEQFDRVIEAIIDGRYSWACVLILRFAGYNPLNYIPYRTYNRLSKDNHPKGKSDELPAETTKASDKSTQANSNLAAVGQSKSRLEDLCYLEVEEQCEQIRGGASFEWLFKQFSFVSGVR